MEIYLSIGSNLGDRRRHILTAVEKLSDFFRTSPAALSEMHESEAWGFEGPKFLDAVVRYDIPAAGQDPLLHSHALLRQCKRIEKEAGRKEEPLFDAKGRRIYHDRPVDVDILFYGKQTIKTEILTIPHPMIPVRDFILKPLSEVVSEEIRAAFSDFFRGND